MSTEDDILSIIFTAIDEINDEKEPDQKIEKALETVLFGDDAGLDSLDLVSMIVDIEGAASEAFDMLICLSDDKAMDRDPVPFTSVSNLKGYILQLVSENSI